jgi:hypothetical protein
VPCIHSDVLMKIDPILQVSPARAFRLLQTLQSKVKGPGH